MNATPKMRHPRRPLKTKKQSQMVMSPHTKDFLQKICYKRTASVDMTQYGFICDSKVSPVNLMLKPLREKLQSICGPSANTSRCASYSTRSLRDTRRQSLLQKLPNDKPPTPCKKVTLCLPATAVRRNPETKKFMMINPNLTLC